MVKSLSSRQFRKKQLFRFRYKEGTIMNDHISNFKKVISELSNVGEKVPDEDQVMLLLCSFPETFDTLIQSILGPKATITLEEACSCLLSDEFRKLDSVSSNQASSQAVGLIVKGNENESGKNKSRSKGKKGRLSAISVIRKDT